jgi:hypothetical protein
LCAARNVTTKQVNEGQFANQKGREACNSKEGYCAPLMALNYFAAL